MKGIFAVLSVCCILYGGAFIAIHSFPVLRRPAANLSYWYYSDNDVIETIEFYGFWPLRQFAYRLGFCPATMTSASGSRILRLRGSAIELRHLAALTERCTRFASVCRNQLDPSHNEQNHAPK